MEKVFTKTEKNKRNESHTFVINLSQTLDLRSPNKHVALVLLLFITHGIIQENSLKTIN